MNDTQAHIDAASNATDATEPIVGTAPQPTPREARALVRLLEGPSMREELQRIAKASNLPDLIHRLRSRPWMGYDGIQTVRVTKLDADGRTVSPGEYSLTEQGRLRLFQAGLTLAYLARGLGAA